MPHLIEIVFSGVFIVAREIENIQNYLKRYEYLDVDVTPGVFCEATEEALKKFQRQFDLEPDGSVGRLTKQAMLEPRCFDREIVRCSVLIAFFFSEFLMSHEVFSYINRPCSNLQPRKENVQNHYVSLCPAHLFSHKYCFCVIRVLGILKNLTCPQYAPFHSKLQLFKNTAAIRMAFPHKLSSVRL